MGTICDYQYYKEDETYYPHIYCKLTNKYCMYQKKCEMVEKFIPIEDEKWKECYMYIMEQQKNIPKDSYLIQTARTNKHGKTYLYVIIDDCVEKITTDIKVEDIKQNYIYVKETKDGYVVSLNPFKKTTPQRKTKDNE